MYNKCYYESLLRRVAILEQLYLEGAKDDLRKYLGDELYNNYMNIRDRISDTDWTDFGKIQKRKLSDIRNYVNNFQSKSGAKKQARAEGATKLYEDDDWEVYKITTYPAAQQYGRNTKWCITGNYPGNRGAGESFFNQYIRNNNLDGGYYFYISKHDPFEKYCVLQTKDGDINSIWSADDTFKGTSMGDIDVDLPVIKEVNLKDNSDADLLVRAVRTGNVKTVKNLLSSGIDPNTKTSDGTPVICIAASNGDPNTVSALLRAGANPNAFDKKNGASALDDIIMTQNSSDDGNRTIALLLKYGANCSKNTFNNLCRDGNYVIIKNLLDSGVTPYDDSLWAAGRFTTPENIKVMELLLQAGADPNVEDMYGETILQHALNWNSTKDIVKKYIDTLRKYGAK